MSISLLVMMMLMKSILSFQKKLPHTPPNIVESVVYDVFKIQPIISLFFHSSGETMNSNVRVIYEKSSYYVVILELCRSYQILILKKFYLKKGFEEYPNPFNLSMKRSTMIDAQYTCSIVKKTVTPLL